ncbi:S1 family peptidase [Bdellovibrio sp. HCB2-146]|uniref:S1 family peptidase n=1 Tax=Bdellovibrio sp. HCB2-146 TaxID=3394362 RepID=UPI0039BD2DAD
MSRFVIALAAIALVSCGAPKSSVSGKNGSQIMGGTEVKDGAQIAKSIVALWDREMKAVCTATIIAENFIVTAAHCANKPQHLKVVFGAEMDYYLNSHEDDILQMHVRQVTDVVVHEDYDEELNEKKNTDHNDIALMRFAGKLPEGYEPVTFLPDDSVLQKGVRTYLAGYGVDFVDSQEIDPRKVKNIKKAIESGEIECDDDLRYCVKITTSGDGILRETSAIINLIGLTEVVVDESKGHGTCMGDSGGPAFVKWENVYYLYGVTSRGSPMCDGKGIYTNAVYFRPWLEQHMARLRR